MASKKNMELRKAKEKRQKIIAIGGAVLLLAVLAIRVPPLLKHGSSAPKSVPVATSGTSSPDASSTAAPASGSAAAPTAAVPTAQPASVSSSELADSDVPVAPAAGQLVVFDRFESKDPFVQQVSADDNSSGGSAPAASSSSGATQTTPSTPASAPTTTTPSSSSPASSQPSSNTTTIQPVDTKATPTGVTVVISTNGVSEKVAVGSAFPSKSPVFRLVSVTSAGAQIAVDGGSYADGSDTITLVKAKQLVLLDTTTRVQYRLVYVSGPNS